MSAGTPELVERIARATVRSQVRRVGVGLLRGKSPVFAMARSVGTNALGLAFNVLTGVTTARLLGPEGRGVYAAVTVWPPLLALLSVAGLNSSIVFRLRKAPERTGSAVAASLLLAAATSLVAILIGVFAMPALLGKYSVATVIFAQWCLLSVFTNSLQNVMKQTFAGLGHYGRCNLTAILPQFLHLATLLLMIVFLTITANDVAIALLVSGAATVAILMPTFIRATRPRLTGAWEEIRKLASYSGRAAGTDVVFALATYADRIVLVPLLPPDQLGLYAVAFSFSRLIQIAQPAIASVMLSHMASQDGDRLKPVHDHAFRFLLASLVVGCIVFWLAGSFLLRFAYGRDFVAASTIFHILTIEAALGALSQLNLQLFMARDRPGVGSTIQVTVLCLSVGLLLLLVPAYGAVGAASALMLAGLTRWILLMGAVRWILGLQLPRPWLNGDDFRYLKGRLR